MTGLIEPSPVIGGRRRHPRRPSWRTAGVVIAVVALVAAGAGSASAAGTSATSSKAAAPGMPTAPPLGASAVSSKTALGISAAFSKAGTPGAVASPVVSGPVTGGTHGFPFTSSAVDLRSYGYAEQEYFFSGTARTFTSEQPLTGDGKWKVQQGSPAPYKSRMVVRAPIDPKRFNGTVVVEWLNVTAGRDIDVDWDYGYNQLLRDGFAYVGVTAQTVGFNALTAWDPERYGSLSSPSDDYSYDIFSQAGQALRSTGPGSPLRGLRARHLIADGESQSAGRMTTYVNAVAPSAKVYDGYLIHSNGATGAVLSGTLRPPTPTFLRTDLSRPVLNFETETDVLGHLSARQPDDRFHRLWEAAGTAHVDNDILVFMGYQSHRQTPQSIDPVCTAQRNTASQSYLFDTAYAALRSWVVSGKLPPTAPRMQINAEGTDVARDSFGNGLGGIRLPQLEVPTATLTGVGNTAADANPISAFCRLFGTTVPFDAATLAKLYPTHNAYVRAFTAATRKLAAQGFLLPDDERAALFAAEQASVPAG
ncbi:alpha/beta hydrolase domain-containing protein [Streptosporangium subroseum]|uniref:alpha/beta hydrolase domain-containing protein n=1 Tax=Streptosporangium subroseum TaxID=106412 RepID=UPI003090066A|nr:alpha/beta hydrolase domain-containing protein [Streptosporangium subroseum]